MLTEKGILDSVLENYQSATKQWSRTIQNHATTLFLYLVGISMVWNFIPLIFRRSSIAEFFGEMFRFLTFTGFYLWLLRNGPSIAIAIINSMQKIGADTGETQSIYPSDIIDIGFKVFHQAVDSISALSPINSAGCLII